MNGEINYDSDKLEAFINDARQMAAVLAEKRAQGALANGTLLGSGIKSLDKNISKMSEKVNSVSQIVSRQSDSFFTAEHSLATEAENIEIPHNFELNNYGVQDTSEIAVSDVNKGRDINEDNNTNEQVYSEYETAKSDDLGDISNDNANEEQAMTDSYGKEDESLGDISNDNANNEQVLDDSHREEYIAVDNINNETETTLQELNDEHANDKENLEDVNVGVVTAPAEAKEIEEDRKNIDNINNGEETTLQEIKDEHKSTVENIENINSGEGTLEQELNVVDNITEAAINTIDNNAPSEGIPLISGSNIQSENLASTNNSTTSGVTSNAPTGENKEELSMNEEANDTLGSTYEDTHKKNETVLADQMNNTLSQSATYEDSYHTLNDTLEKMREEAKPIEEEAPVSYASTYESNKEKNKIEGLGLFGVLGDTKEKSNSFEEEFSKF